MPEITQEEFELFEQYKSLGEFDEIAGHLQSAMEARFNDLASKNGYKPSVLKKLVNALEGKRLVFGEDNEGFIADLEGEEQIPLKEFAEQEWEEFLPALTAEAKSAATEAKATYVAQSAKGRTAKKSGKKATENFLKQQYGWVLGNNAVK